MKIKTMTRMALLSAIALTIFMVEAQIPLGRVGQPGEAAEAFVFLPSGQSPSTLSFPWAPGRPGGFSWFGFCWAPCSPVK